MKIHHKSFIAGVLVVAALRSLYMDMLGLDGFIEAVKLSWVDWKISVPLAVVTLFFIPYLLRKP